MRWFTFFSDDTTGFLIATEKITFRNKNSYRHINNKNVYAININRYFYNIIECFVNYVQVFFYVFCIQCSVVKINVKSSTRRKANSKINQQIRLSIKL